MLRARLEVWLDDLRWRLVKLALRLYFNAEYGAAWDHVEVQARDTRGKSVGGYAVIDRRQS